MKFQVECTKEYKVKGEVLFKEFETYDLIIDKHPNKRYVTRVRVMYNDQEGTEFIGNLDEYFLSKEELNEEKEKPYCSNAIFGEKSRCKMQCLGCHLNGGERIK